MSPLQSRSIILRSHRSECSLHRGVSQTLAPALYPIVVLRVQVIHCGTAALPTPFMLQWLRLLYYCGKKWWRLRPISPSRGSDDMCKAQFFRKNKKKKRLLWSDILQPIREEDGVIEPSFLSGVTGVTLKIPFPKHHKTWTSRYYGNNNKSDKTLMSCISYKPSDQSEYRIL